MTRRAEVDAGVRGAVEQLLASTNLLALLRAKWGAQLPALASPAAAAANDAEGVPLVELLYSGELPRPAGAALVDDWECLRVRRGGGLESAPPAVQGWAGTPGVGLG